MFPKLRLHSVDARLVRDDGFGEPVLRKAARIRIRAHVAPTIHLHRVAGGLVADDGFGEPLNKARASSKHAEEAGQASMFGGTQTVQIRAHDRIDPTTGKIVRVEAHEEQRHGSSLTPHPGYGYPPHVGGQMDPNLRVTGPRVAIRVRKEPQAESYQPLVDPKAAAAKKIGDSFGRDLRGAAERLAALDSKLGFVYRPQDKYPLTATPSGAKAREAVRAAGLVESKFKPGSFYLPSGAAKAPDLHALADAEEKKALANGREPYPGHSPGAAAPAAKPASGALPAGHRKETLGWRGEARGNKAGDVISPNKRDWVVVVSAGKAKTRRLTSDDEDMGQGVEGDTKTYQDVVVRDATPEEAAAEQARRAAAAVQKQAAADDADPRKRGEKWAASVGATEVNAHRGAEISKMGLTWHEEVRQQQGPLVSNSFLTATGPDGKVYGKCTNNMYDDHRDPTYYEVRTQDEAVKQANDAANKRRGELLEWAQQYGFHPQDLDGFRDADQLLLRDMHDNPRTPEEREGMAAAKAVHATKDHMRHTVDRITATGILHPDDVETLHSYVAGADPGIRSLHGHNNARLESHGIPEDVWKHLQGRTDGHAPTTALDVHGAMAVRDAREGGAEHQQTMTPGARATYGAQKSYPSPHEAWDRLSHIEAKAAERGTSEHIKPLVDEAREHLLTERPLTDPKTARSIVERGDVHPFYREQLRRFAATTGMAKLPKKTQAAIHEATKTT